MNLPDSPKIPVDGHVHFHDPRLVEPTLGAAARNFRALRIADPAPPRGVLLLAQYPREAVFDWLREQQRVGTWKITGVPAEPHSLWLRCEASELLVVCGYQVDVERGLELLVLGTNRPIAGGLGFVHTVREARARGALAVLPWGFGKWTGRRKRLVRAAINSADLTDMWMGDNGGRLSALPRPPLLAEGERAGHAILPGSDPFPFGDDYRRVGSFGCLVPTVLDPERPWQSLRIALVRHGSSPEAYGRAAGLLEFSVKQARIQVHKRYGGRAS
jgi:hypothetical protein